MKPKRLLIAVALLAVLGGAVWYTRENPPADEDAAPKVVEFDEDALKSLTLHQAGQDPIALVRNADGEWEFGGGLDLAADDGAIGQMASSLASLNADRVVSENVVEWGPYELSEPALSVAYELEEGGGELQFGRDTPTGSGVFARLNGDPRLFTVYSYNKTSFEKSVFDLRDKRLVRVDQDSISEVTVQASGRSLAFEQEDGDWSIVHPMALRADDFTVGDLVRAVRTAEMTEVLDETNDSDEYSFAKLLATVTIQDEAGSHELVVAKSGDTYYARSSDQAGVYGISSTLSESLDKPVDEFRNKKLFDFGFDDPARVEVRDGEVAATIVRADDKWILESHADREADSEKVQTLIDRLRGLTATGFPSNNAADHAKFGLAPAAIDTAVTPQGDEASPEKVAISSPESQPAYAARVGEPHTYEIEQSAAQSVQTALQAVLADPAEAESADPEAEGDAP